MKKIINILVRHITLTELVGVVISAVILCTIALYNFSPLIFNADSAMYIEAAHRRVVEQDRPILYGLFIKYFSFKISLWLVVISQSAIVSFVLFCYFNSFRSDSLKKITTIKFTIYFLCFTLLISVCMGASFQVGWLMSDIFTPVAILIMGLILFTTDLSRIKLALLSIMLILSIAMHNSNFYICFGLIIILLFGHLLAPIRTVYQSIRLTINKMCAVLILIIISNLTLSTIHYFYGGKFESSRGGVIFLMGNVVEMGIVDTYLNDQCGTKNYELCKYKDSIPNNFIWDSRSPIYKTGGWKGSQKEYSAILKDILTKPKYLKSFIFNSAILTLKQFATFETGEAGKPWRRVNLAIRNYHYNDFKNFMSSKQSEQKLDFTIINFFQNVVFGLCMMLYVIAFYSIDINIKYKAFALFILLALVINAFICGTFSGVFPRYQSRVVWLVPLPIFLYLMENSLAIKIIRKQIH